MKEMKSLTEGCMDSRSESEARGWPTETRPLPVMLLHFHERLFPRWFNSSSCHRIASHTD